MSGLSFGTGYTPVDPFATSNGGALGYNLAPINTVSPAASAGASIASPLSNPTNGMAAASAGLSGGGYAQGGSAPAGGVGGGANWLGDGGILQTGLGALQILGNLWSSFQQINLAKQQLNFQKESYATNLANQEMSYNTALEDQITSRYQREGKSQAEADAYIQSHSL